MVLRRVWLVDGMNLIGTRPDGWWRDTDAAIERLVEELRSYARDTGEPVMVVFDYRPRGLRPGASDGLKVHFAAGGPQAADAMIADLVRESPEAYHVVTSDRGLRSMVEASGAPVVGAGTFRRRMDDA